MLDCTANGRVAQPSGHASRRACPHGVYQTAGVERYVAIAVETAGQWQALRSVTPLGPFDGREMAELEARLQRRDAIDAVLRDWARRQDPWELATMLKRTGVPAGVVQRPSDLYADPQLAHRGFFVPLEHHEMGLTPYDGFATRFSATPGRLRNAAPCLGQDTESVLRQLLGLSEDEVRECAEAGVLA